MNLSSPTVLKRNCGLEEAAERPDLGDHAGEVFGAAGDDRCAMGAARGFGDDGAVGAEDLEFPGGRRGP